MKISKKELLEAINLKKAMLAKLAEADSSDDDEKDDEDEDEKVDEACSDDEDEDDKDDKEMKSEGEESDDDSDEDEDDEKVNEADEDDDEDEDDEKEADEKKVDESLAKFRKALSETKFESAELGSLLESEGLTADFKSKAATIFEAAVNAKIAEQSKLVESAYKKVLSEDIEASRKQIAEAFMEHMAQLDEHADGYITSVANAWVKENKIQLESALKVNAAENLIEGIRQLFAENNITIPEGKESVVETLEDRCVQLEAELDASANALIEAKKEINSLVRESAIQGFTKGMTEVKAAKIRGLAESVDFVSEASFTEKLRMLSENFSSDKPVPAKEQLLEEGDAPVKTVSTMAQQLSALNKSDWFRNTK